MNYNSYLQKKKKQHQKTNLFASLFLLLFSKNFYQIKTPYLSSNSCQITKVKQ